MKEKLQLRYAIKIVSIILKAIFAIGDINNDGEIDINEFINVLCPNASTLIARISKEFKNIESAQV